MSFSIVFEGKEDWFELYTRFTLNITQVVFIHIVHIPSIYKFGLSVCLFVCL